jgi:putative spermidine/putrescine transport system permease protein
MDYSPLDRAGLVAAGAVVLAGLVVMLAPIVMTVVLSTSESFTFPPQGFTLRWYANFVSRPEFIGGLQVSLILAALVVVIATMLGIGISLTMTRRAFRGGGALNFLFLSPIMLPRVAIGVALFLFFITIHVQGTLLRLLVLHLIITCPYVVAAVTASLQGIDPSFEEAAMNLGAPPWETFRKVTLPLMQPGIVAGAIFAFVVSFDEVTASVFLTDAQTTTFPVALFLYLARGTIDPTVAAASSFMLVSVALVGLILARYVGLARALGVAK